MHERIRRTAIWSGFTLERLNPRFQSWIVANGTPDTLDSHLTGSPASRQALIRATRASGCRIEPLKGQGQQISFRELVGPLKGSLSHAMKASSAAMMFRAKGNGKPGRPAGSIEDMMNLGRRIAPLEMMAKDAPQRGNAAHVFPASH